MMRREVNRGLLRFAVGRVLGECPSCGGTFDADSAVLITAGSRSGDKTFLACGACWDETASRLPADVRSRLDVIDGREL